MNFFDYAFHHMACVTRLVRGEQNAWADMDISADGFWRSFGAITAAIPALFFAWVVEARHLQAEGVAGTTGSIVARMAVLELLFWILPVIGLAIALRLLGMSGRFTHLIIARNWLAALLSYLFVAVPLITLVSNGTAEGLTGWMTIAILAVMLWLSVRITRFALNTTPLVALAFIVVETLITFPLAMSLYAVVGLNPAA
jgi:hypothetical protein